MQQKKTNQKIKDLEEREMQAPDTPPLHMGMDELHVEDTKEKAQESEPPSKQQDGENEEKPPQAAPAEVKVVQQVIGASGLDPEVFNKQIQQILA